MRNMSLAVVAGLVVLVLLLAGCQSKIETEADLFQSYQDALDTMVKQNKNTYNAVLMVQSPDISWQGASGMADPEAGVQMLPDDQFRSASSAKIMLSTLAMKLSEQGTLALDVPIAEYLPVDVIEGLHVYEGHNYSQVITMRHLLQHTSGLADDWFDEQDEGRFVKMALEDETDRLWEPVELVNYVKENLPPHFAPGEGFNYSDVNYVLAGLVIEATTGRELHDVYRTELFGPLGMEHTYMEFREPARPSIAGRSLSHVYYEDIDYTEFQSISADWAGGGLVTTAQDMTRFMQAFAHDEIFANPETREAMFDWVVWEEGSMDYGLGVMHIKGKTLTIWGHLGVGQSFIFYWPEGDMTLCGTMNQNEVQVGGFISQILKATKSYQE